MRIVSLSIDNFRSFPSISSLHLGRINVFTGKNNSGKSSIIKALHLLQSDGGDGEECVRTGSKTARIALVLEDVFSITAWDPHGDSGHAFATIALGNGTSARQFRLSSQNGSANVSQFPNVEPFHFVVPFLSKRKAVAFMEDVRRQNTLQVSSDMSFLSAKLSRLSNPSFPGHDLYTEYCKRILGFALYTVPSENGQRPGIYLPDGSSLLIESMGEGVANIASLLASLVSSKNKLFLIEEPENDLHPEALKSLLELIVKSSSENQFVVSTHSNIVVQYLASASDSKLFNVSNQFGVLPPLSTVDEVPPNPSARLAALADLGYSLGDFDLWDGWLILEESSAERIIRDFLIPWFYPKLSSLRTISANGISGVSPTFNDLHRMLKFAHLTPIYQERTWVFVDGDEPGIHIIAELRQAYSGWEENRFQTFKHPNFENYYPQPFGERVKSALTEKNKDTKREAKRALLIDVVNWLQEDPQRGKDALSASAGEILEYLSQIQEQMLGARTLVP